MKARREKNNLSRFLSDLFLCGLFYLIYPYIWDFLFSYFPSLADDPFFPLLQKVSFYLFLATPFIFTLKSDRLRGVFIRLLYTLFVFGFSISAIFFAINEWSLFAGNPLDLLRKGVY